MRNGIPLASALRLAALGCALLIAAGASRGADLASTYSDGEFPPSAAAAASHAAKSPCRQSAVSGPRRSARARAAGASRREARPGARHERTPIADVEPTAGRLEKAAVVGFDDEIPVER